MPENVSDDDIIWFLIQMRPHVTCGSKLILYSFIEERLNFIPLICKAYNWSLNEWSDKFIEEFNTLESENGQTRFNAICAQLLIPNPFHDFEQDLKKIQAAINN